MSKLHMPPLPVTVDPEGSNIVPETFRTNLEVDSKTEVDAKLEALRLAIVNGAPEALDVLSELSEAINNDPDYATTIATALAAKAAKDGSNIEVANFKTALALNLLQNYGIASQAEAQAGTATNKYMTPLRTAQAIANLAQGGFWDGHVVQETELSVANSTTAVLSDLIFDPATMGGAGRYLLRFEVFCDQNDVLGIGRTLRLRSVIDYRDVAANWHQQTIYTNYSGTTVGASVDGGELGSLLCNNYTGASYPYKRGAKAIMDVVFDTVSNNAIGMWFNTSASVSDPLFFRSGSLMLYKKIG